MNPPNIILRIRGWISALRPFAPVVLILGIFLLISLGSDLYQAYRVSTSPEVEIAQLVSGEIGVNDYVTITGLALYEARLDETQGDNLVAVFVPVIDLETGAMVFVRSTQDTVMSKEGAEIITLSGKTAAPEDELVRVISEDLDVISDAGLTTTLDLYIDKVLEPDRINRLLLQLGGVGIGVFLCAAVIAMPAIVFNPEPLAVGLSAAGVSLGIVQVSGKLFKSVKNNPLEATRRKQHFSRANANLIKDATSGLIVSVHHVVTHRTYGIKTGQTESDWLVKLTPYQVVRIEPGKLYTFVQHQAVRIVYKTEADKEAVLVFSFDNDQDQVAFINLLKEMGFAIQWLGYANTI